VFPRLQTVDLTEMINLNATAYSVLSQASHACMQIQAVLNGVSNMFQNRMHKPKEDRVMNGVGVGVSCDDENGLRYESKEDNNSQKRMRSRYGETKRIKFT
jgi:hypothetical protein